MKPERFCLSPNYEISQVITGLWQVADLEKDGSELDVEVAAESLVEYALDGFDTFDMADHYGSAELISGRAQEILQRQQQNVDSLNPARFHTKWCPKPGVMLPKVVRDAIDERADRLRVESIDLLQFHWWTFQHPGYLDAMEGLVLAQQSGRINKIGLTNFDTNHLRVLVRHGFPVVSNQVVVSMLDQRGLEEMAKVVLENNIKLLAYGVLAGGFLTEKWLDKPEPANSDLSDWSKMKYKRFIDETGGWGNLQNILRALKSVAQRHGVSIANVATRWVLDHPAVGAVIVGARLTENQHREDNVAIFSFSLDEEDRSLIAESVANNRRLKGDCGDEYREPPFLTASGDLSHHLDSFPNVYEPIAVPGKADRIQVFSGTKWEKICGHSRAVKIGNRILVSGTTATHGQDVVVCRGDAAGQAVYVLDKIKASVMSLGGSLSDIVRTRVYLQNAEDCEAVSLVHGRYFRDVCPANTTFEISQLIDDYLVEIEAEAVIEE